MDILIMLVDIINYMIGKEIMRPEYLKNMIISMAMKIMFVMNPHSGFLGRDRHIIPNQANCATVCFLQVTLSHHSHDSQSERW